MLTELLDQRRSYYDLADSLTRLTLQLKDPTSSSLPLAISFLARWFGATHGDNASTLDFMGRLRMLYRQLQAGAQSQLWHYQVPYERPSNSRLAK